MRFPRVRKHIKAVDALLVQAIAATVLSFSHIKEIAEAAGQDDWKAWLYPISVDLLLFAGWQRIRAGHQKGAAWSWFLIALGASLAANIATAGVVDLDNPPVQLQVIVGGWPALAFLGGTLLVHGRKKPNDGPEETTEPATETPESVDVPSELPTIPEVLATLPEVPLVDAPAEEPLPAPDPSSIVTVKDAAEATGINPNTIRGWANNGRIAHHGYEGRSTLVDLLEVRACRQPA